ncbi:MAG: hypothetical protein K1000chlam2_00179 [Chlamydiae bacterium]|nr:hypothetical protein [Chlamydiota bacterium]
MALQIDINLAQLVLDRASDALNMVTPEIAIVAIVATTVALALFNHMRQPVEVPSKKDIVPLPKTPQKVDPIVSQAIKCPHCHRPMGDFQVVVIDPLADFDWMLNQFFISSVLTV